MSANTSPLANFNAVAFLQKLDGHVDLKGRRVVFYDGQNMKVLREESKLVCFATPMTVVVKPHLGDPTVKSAQAAASRDGRFYSELLGGVLSCGGAAIGWVVVGASSGAAPLSGGASMFIAVTAGTAAIASTLQCGNSAYRIYNGLIGTDVNEWLDSQSWYTRTSLMLDVLSLAGVGATAVTGIRAVKLMQRSTGKSMVEVLKGISRQERRRITEEIIRLQNPGISNSALKTMVRAGAYPKRYLEISVTRAVQLQLADALSAAMSVAGSAKDGAVKELTVGVVSSFEIQ